jgi:hypothetical protein
VSSREFNNSPVLLSSLPIRNRQALAKTAVSFHLLQDTRIWENDTLFLTTDALGQWFLTQWEKEARPWETLEQINFQEEFAEFVVRSRTAKELRNDDSTLVVISVETDWEAILKNFDLKWHK